MNQDDLNREWIELAPAWIKEAREGANPTRLGNIVGFAAIAALDVWGLFSGARQLTKVFAIIHLLFAFAFIWLGRMSMSAKTS
jgi:hypothetical protein